MKKFCYSILIPGALALLFNHTTLSGLALGETDSAAGSATVTEADFGSAGMGSLGNTTNYSIAPNTAYDNMNYEQSNTSAAGAISDYSTEADANSANSNSANGNFTSKETPIGRGFADKSRGLPTPGSGLQSTMTGNLAAGLESATNPLNKLSIPSGSYNFGFTGKVLPSLYAINRGISLPQVSTGSIIMNDGFSPY